MIGDLKTDGRVITAARISRLFPVLSPFAVLELSRIDMAILIAAAEVAAADEAAKYGEKKKPDPDMKTFDDL